MHGNKKLKQLYLTDMYRKISFNSKKTQENKKM